MREEYDADHSPDLLTRLGIRGHQSFWHSETSGDTANELEVLSVGVPRNDRERAEVAALQMRQQIRDAGVLGPLVAGEEFRQLKSDYRRLMSIMGADGVGFDARWQFHRAQRRRRADDARPVRRSRQFRAAARLQRRPTSPSP